MKILIIIDWKKKLKTLQMHQRLNHKGILYTALRDLSQVSTVKLNILQLQHLMNALKFTLFIYFFRSRKQLGSHQIDIDSNFYIPRSITDS